MKCDDFLPFLETGGWWRRWQAKRHARHCAGCAAAQAMLVELKREFAKTPPLTDRLEHMWRAAARVEHAPAALSVRPRVRPAFRYAVAAVAIALAVLVPLAVRWNENHDRKGQDEIAVKPGALDGPGALEPKRQEQRSWTRSSRIAIAMADVVLELKELEDNITRLKEDINQLANASHKLEAEQEIDQVLARHSSW